MRPTAARHTTVSRVQTAGVIRRAAVQRGEVADRTRPVTVGCGSPNRSWKSIKAAIRVATSSAREVRSRETRSCRRQGTGEVAERRDGEIAGRLERDGSAGKRLAGHAHGAGQLWQQLRAASGGRAGGLGANLPQDAVYPSALKDVLGCSR